MKNAETLTVLQVGIMSGTCLYGKTKPQKAIDVGYLKMSDMTSHNIYSIDGASYVATKWFVFFFIPLIPLKTFFILQKNKDKSFDIGFLKRESYSVVPLKNLFWRQIIRTYLVPLSIFLIIVLYVLLPSLLRTDAEKQELCSKFANYPAMALVTKESTPETRQLDEEIERLSKRYGYTSSHEAFEDCVGSGLVWEEGAM